MYTRDTWRRDRMIDVKAGHFRGKRQFLHAFIGSPVEVCEFGPILCSNGCTEDDSLIASHSTVGS